MNSRTPENNPGVSCVVMYRFVVPDVHKKFSVYYLELHFVRPDVCAVKFYPKAFKNSKDKYRLLTGQYAAKLIIDTCFQICFDYLDENKTTSFAFVGINGIAEKEMNNTKRFRIYSMYSANLLSTNRFYHLSDPESSSYLLLNKDSESASINDLEDITKEFTRLYNIEIDWQE